MIEFSKITDLCTKMGYSKPTIINIEALYQNVEVNQVFGAAYVRKILSCADSTARSLISKLRDMEVVVSVVGKGKGINAYLERIGRTRPEESLEIDPAVADVPEYPLAVARLREELKRQEEQARQEAERQK